MVNVPGGGQSRNVRRPDVVPGVEPILFNNGLAYVNPAAFSVPRPGTFGNSARNSLAGPAIAQLDLTLSKKFNITEQVNIAVSNQIGLGTARQLQLALRLNF